MFVRLPLRHLDGKTGAVFVSIITKQLYAVLIFFIKGKHLCLATSPLSGA